LNIEVPVLEGTGDLILNRGVGHVEGTAHSRENGNVAIAGHRDGFFRGLKDIALGDTIEMVTLSRRKLTSSIGSTIVDRSDVSVLQPRPHTSLTLINLLPVLFSSAVPPNASSFRHLSPILFRRTLMLAGRRSSTQEVLISKQPQIHRSNR